MWSDLALVVIGLVLLFLGGEGLVRGSVAMATRLGLSKRVVGLTVVGFGTSSPELVVSLDAALRESPEIALGTVIGSNVANGLLILGLAAAARPLSGWRRGVLRDALVAVLVALALVGLVHGPTIGRIEGLALLLTLAAYLAASYWIEARGVTPAVDEAEADAITNRLQRRLPVAVVATLAGIGLVMLGADLLVQGAVSIARDLGVGEAAIGLSLVAVGTSLPELAAVLVAALRRHTDLVLGSVIGSTIFNGLGILGATAVVHPIAVAPRFRDFDALVVLAVGAALLFALVAAPRIGRASGAAMVGLYALYLGAVYAIAG